MVAETDKISRYWVWRKIPKLVAQRDCDRFHVKYTAEIVVMVVILIAPIPKVISLTIFVIYATTLERIRTRK